MEQKTMNVLVHLKLYELQMAIDQKGRIVVKQAEELMDRYEKTRDIEDYILSTELLGKAKGLALAQAMISKELEAKIEIEGGEE